MIAVVIGLVLIVAIAAGIVAMVAAPRLRGGEELLTPGGKETIIRASQQTREQSAAAAVSTWHWAASLRSKLSRLWAPASRALHEQFDRLEGQSHPPVRHSAGPAIFPPLHGEVLEPPGVPPAGSPVVGRPRQMPDESGPIPIEEDGDVSAHRHPGDDEPAVINLRGSAPGDAPRPSGRISPDVTTRRIR